MERRGGCCTAQYSMHNKLDRIMLKYRPIAPKPPVGGAVSGSSSSSPEKGDVYVKIGRGKRRFVRDVDGKRKGKAVVTLPLLPENPDPREEKNGPIWLSFSGEGKEKKDKCKICKFGFEDPARESCVTVECVTETWTEGEGVVMSNEERVMRLEKDTCPGMITDGDNRVLWVNRAYREMEGEMMGEVLVMMKQWVKLPVTCPAFTCRVSWSTCRKGKGKGKKKPLTLPCDVWKMNGVGFAWRLDVKAALCLAL